MKLASILSEDLIFTGVSGTDRKSIYADILQRIGEKIGGRDFAGITEPMIEREDVTGIPYEGVAFPHLRVPDIDDLYVAVILLDKPVKLKENDLADTRVIVMSLISSTTSDVYLKCLSAFVRFFSGRGRLDKLCGASDAAAVKAIVEASDIKIKKTITADDLMSRKFASVKPDDLLAHAFDLLNAHHTAVLPVIDDDGKLVGEVQAEQVIRKFIPEYIFMMENVNFLNSFEAFDRFFKEENNEIVRNFMREPAMTIAPDMPLIQFTLALVREDVKKIFVVDGQKKLLGELSIINIIHKVLRG